MNLSQKKRQRMLDLLSRIRDEHKNDEDMLIAINEIESELNAKKYGLVWEEHEEAVDVKMRTHIPVFTEDPDKEITSALDDNYNFLLEGDNLHSLYLLEKTHKGRIDVIYIDPPYNTGGKDFIYDDSYVDKSDGFRHSKWLSFMTHRLLLAHQLLSDKGLIFISIDDNEVAQLKMLCNEIFGEMNFRGQIARATGTPTGQGNAIISNEIDYILVYARSDLAVFNGIPFDEEDAKIYNLEDQYGRYLIRPLRKTGGEDRREDRPSMYYSVKAPDGTDVFPIAPSGYESRWRCQESTYKELLNNHRIEWKNDKSGWKVYQKFYLEGRTKQPGNLWIGIEGNKKATITLKDILGVNTFSFPKSVGLIKQIIQVSADTGSIILDFFAGSGTTAQAVLELNQQDGGHRKFILCTNNENNICSEVTYPRVKTVITGKRDDGSIYSDGIPANLKYYRTDFVARDEEYLSDALLEHIKEMIELENAVKIDGSNYIMVLDEEEADELAQNWSKYPNVKAIYVSSDVLFTTEQTKIFADTQVYIIPDYYFEFDLRQEEKVW